MIKTHAKTLGIVLIMGVFLSGCNLFPYLVPSTTSTPDKDPDGAVTPTMAPTNEVATITPVLDEPEVSPTTLVKTPIEESIITPESKPRFMLQYGNPIYLPNFNHPESGCEWLGIAGQVFDEEGREIKDLWVMSGRTSDNEDEVRSALTGTALAYGLGGYEIQLLEDVMESEALFWVKILDQDGQALSEQIFFDTIKDCDKNLIILNFIPHQSLSTPTPGLMPEPKETLEAYP